LKTFKQAVRDEQFTLTAELTLRPVMDAAAVRRQAGMLEPVVDAIQFSDNPRGQPQMSALAAASLLLEQGIDPVPLISCRDRNRIALQSDILGLGVLGVSSLLLMHGDRLPEDHQPPVKQVFELGGKGLLRIARELAADADAPVPDFFIGAVATAFNPNADWQPRALLAKADAGADFVQTQLCFDMTVLRRYVEKLVAAQLTWRAPIVVSVGVLPSADSARWLADNLRGSLMPEATVKRLQQASDPEREGVTICAELLQELSEIPGVCGANLVGWGDPALIPAAISESGLRR